MKRSPKIDLKFKLGDGGDWFDLGTIDAESKNDSKTAEEIEISEADISEGELLPMYIIDGGKVYNFGYEDQLIEVASGKRLCSLSINGEPYAENRFLDIHWGVADNKK